MSDDTTSALAYVTENPRTVGFLFAIMLALSQAGNVAAASGSTTY